MKNALKDSSTSSPALNWLVKHKLNVGLILGLIVILIGAMLFIPKFFNREAPVLPIQEVDLPFDAEGPYAILEPRRDGNAIILKMKRVAGYEKINYELAYQSQATPNDGEGGDGEAIDRGVTGDIKTEGKSEFAQEILFGTCSKGDTFSTLHCVFDKGVENGTLVLRITQPYKSGDKVTTVYKIVTTWHFQQPDVALGVITSGDSHFSYTTTANRNDLSNVAFTVVNDLSGAPKLTDGKAFVGKVYALNVPTAKTFPSGQVVIELADAPTADMKIGRYDSSKDEWQMLDAKIDGSRLTATAESNGIFAVIKDSQ